MHQFWHDAACISPSPGTVFASIGRVVWRDVGPTAVCFRLLMKVCLQVNLSCAGRVGCRCRLLPPPCITLLAASVGCRFAGSVVDLQRMDGSVMVHGTALFTCWHLTSAPSLSLPTRMQLVDYNLMAFATAVFAPFMADFKRYAKKD